MARSGTSDLPSKTSAQRALECCFQRSEEPRELPPGADAGRVDGLADLARAEGPHWAVPAIGIEMSRLPLEAAVVEQTPPLLNGALDQVLVERRKEGVVAPGWPGACRRICWALSAASARLPAANASQASVNSVLMFTRCSLAPGPRQITCPRGDPACSKQKKKGRPLRAALAFTGRLIRSDQNFTRTPP
jgi:hypothetical protein